MSTEPSGLKALLVDEIERDAKQVAKLEKALAEVRPRLERAKAYYATRFGEDALPGAVETPPGIPVEPPLRKRKRFGHADKCAVAVTEAGKASTPLNVTDIRKLTIAAGFITEAYPSRATLSSTINRSPLFRNQGSGKFTLWRAYTRQDVPAKHRGSLAVVQREPEPLASDLRDASEL